MIEVYSKDNCSFCDKAKILLNEKKLNFFEYKLNVEFTKEELLEKFPQAKTFPVIVVDGVFIGGFSELNLLLIGDNNGY